MCLQCIIIFNRTQFKFVKKSEHDLPLPTPHAQQCCQISFANRFLLSSNYIHSIHNLCWYVCMYIWIYSVHTCMYISYVLVFLQMRCLCVCNCLGRDRIGSVNWIKLKNFPCQNMFVCLFMYVCTRIGLCACVHAGPQSVGGQQQQKSRHYFNEYRDHFRLCLKFLFFELIVCFFYSVDYSMLHYINPYDNRIFITWLHMDIFTYVTSCVKKVT